MPWRSTTVKELRREFVHLAMQPGQVITELCKRFGISPPTGYKWIRRYEEEGEAGLEDQSRRPHHSPIKTSDVMEKRILEVRAESKEVWGGRKIRRRLKNLGHRRVPSASTITEVLRRHGRLNPGELRKPGPYQRFEWPEPNDLWQMDFKGHVRSPWGRCHPLTVLDDCSRYAIALRASTDEKSDTVRTCLIEAFRQYGLPWRMLMDNGSPWGAQGRRSIYTRLELWLMRLGVKVIHSRVLHPETNGKGERFHRTLKAELLGNEVLWSLEECQKRFDEWRMRYNWERPHNALGMEVPGNRYRVSEYSYPEELPEIEYGTDDIVRKVQHGGIVHYHGREYRVPKVFHGQRVALRQRAKEDGIMDVYFYRQRVATIILRGDDKHQEV